MPDVLSIWNLLSELNLAPSTCITLLTPILATLTFWKVPCLRHCRRRWRTAAFFLLLWSAGYAAFLSDWSLKVVSGFIFMLLGYSMLAWYSVNKPIGFSRCIMRKLEQRVKQSVYDQIEDLKLERCPLLLWTYADRLSWSALRYRYLVQMERYKDAYVFLNQIPISHLFPNELDMIHVRQACCLYHLGDINKARMLLESVSNHDISWLHLDSLLWEAKGSLTMAFESLEQAKNKLTNNHPLSASIYNNFGRLRMLQGNNTDAAYYYRLAADHAIKDKDWVSIHVSFQNLVGISTMTEGAGAQTQRLLKEYRGQLDFSRRLDWLEWGNFEIQYTRQVHAEERLPALFEKIYFELYQNAPPHQQRALQINMLRMARNAQMNPEILMKDIRQDFANYLDQPMPERFYLFKELDIFFKSLLRISQQDFNTIYRTVKDYIEHQALQDMEGYLLSLEPWQVHERAKLLQEKAGILKETQQCYSFSKVYRVLLDVADLYEKSGLYIEKIEALLNLADECTYYKNHNVQYMTCYTDEMCNAMQRAEDAMVLISSHPRIAEFHLRLGYYEFFLQKGERALFHLHSFEAQNFSVHHFDMWLREYYVFLKQYEAGKLSSMQDLFKKHFDQTYYI